jgi:hypothetical protein
MNGIEYSVTDMPDAALNTTIVEIRYSLLERRLTFGGVWRDRRKKFDFKVKMRMHGDVVVAQSSLNG